MASQINPYNIDGTFPIAGQDNPSQGFRDNFTNIKNNLLSAANEITDLQSKVIVTSALSGQTITNDMAGTQIRRPQLSAWTQTLFDNGAVSNAVTLDFNVANFQKITTASPISISFVNWPASVGAGALGYGIMRVWVVVSDTSHTLTLPLSVSVAVGDIAGYNSATNAITFDAAGSYVFDFSSTDGGNTYLIFDVTRNRNSVRDPNFYFNPAVSATPTLFVGYGANGGGQTALSLAVAGDQGQSIISGLGSYTATAIGNLSMANTTSATLDTGKIGGYTITSARGNLAQGNIQPVQSGDYLGYINAVDYTGQYGSANAFQQSASIVFYATGSNVAYGLGGNIAFNTADDGGVVPNRVVQAMGIENDQSVHVFGSFYTAGGIVNGGTYLQIFTSSGPNTFTANNAVNTIIIDSASEVTIPLGNIILPSNPVDRQTIVISSIPVITSANVYGGSRAVKFVPTNVFATGNAVTKLTYLASTSTWYRS